MSGLGIAVPLSWVSPMRIVRWSPYYMVVHEVPTGGIVVNSIGHQGMVPYEQSGGSYSLIHLLQQHSGGPPFRDVMIIGAGSGNDLTHALRHGAERVDAVEIDPVIQDIGRGIPSRPPLPGRPGHPPSG